MSNPESEVKSVSIDVDLIRRSRYQPRTEFDQAAIEELANSMEQNGQYNAIRVRPLRTSEGENAFELISGECRWRAAQLNGWSHLRAEIVDHGNEVEYAVEALTDNTKRKDLSPIEEALSYRRLMSEFDLTQEEVAARCSTDRVRVAHLLRLLSLPEDLHGLFRKQPDGSAPRLSFGHGKALAAKALSDQPGEVRRLAYRAAERGWNVRRLEKEVRALTGECEPGSTTDPNIRRLENRVQETICLRTGIDFDQSKGAGQVHIRYNSLEELEGLLERLGIKSTD